MIGIVKGVPLTLHQGMSTRKLYTWAIALHKADLIIIVLKFKVVMATRIMPIQNVLS